MVLCGIKLRFFSFKKNCITYLLQITNVMADAVEKNGHISIFLLLWMNVNFVSTCLMCIEMAKMMYYAKLSTVFISKTGKIPYTHSYLNLHAAKNTSQPTNEKKIHRPLCPRSRKKQHINQRMFN